jgi:outer membrane protein OmpA-like peptidoglycan-associated protein
MNAAEDNQGTFLDSVQSIISTQFMERAGQFLGESPSQVMKGFGAAIPAVLAGIVQKGSTRTGAEQMLSYIYRGEYQRPVISNDVESQLREMSSDPVKSEGLLDNVLGDKITVISQSISQLSGMKSSSITSIMALISSVALGVLGRKFAGTGSSASDLQNYLVHQKSSIGAALPAGLKSVLGFSGVSAAASSISGRRVWPWVVAALALLTLGGILLNRLNRDGAEQTASVSEPPAALYSPDDANVSESGSAESLEAYLTSGSDAELPKRFRFVDLTFESGRSHLDPRSQDIVVRIGQILNQHSSARILLEGHTDSVGSSEVNLKISQDRAQSVKDMLVDQGVDANRIEVAGRGDSQPFVQNDTEANRQLNRRIEIVVLEK